MLLVILHSLVSDHLDDCWLVYNLSDLLTAGVLLFFYVPLGFVAFPHLSYYFSACNPMLIQIIAIIRKMNENERVN